MEESSSILNWRPTVSKNASPSRGGVLNASLDQCYVEQKNGQIVRKAPAMIASSGNSQARQLTELYRALHLYVNCCATLDETADEAARRQQGAPHACYNQAQTPLQRLLASGELAADKHQALVRVTHALDPLRLLHQLEHLQKALWQHTTPPSPSTERTPPASTLPFSVQLRSEEQVPAEGITASHPSLLKKERRRKYQKSGRPHDWRTREDPFEGLWEQITSWLVAKVPERTGVDIFHELQRLYPGRYRAPSGVLCKEFPSQSREMEEILQASIVPFTQNIPFQTGGNNDASTQEKEYHIEHRPVALEQASPALPEQQTFHEHLRTLTRNAVGVVIEEVMREELKQFPGAAWGECTSERKGYRNGTYTRDLATSSGPIEDLEVPRDREGHFHTRVFDRYSRYEPQVAEGLTEMFVAGVSTQKVGEVAQTLMGVAPSASAVSRLNQSLTEQFETWRERPLLTHYRILYLDGIHFTVRHGEQTDSTIILTALGVDLEGNKDVLALRVCRGRQRWMELPLTRSAPSWGNTDGSDRDRWA